MNELERNHEYRERDRGGADPDRPDGENREALRQAGELLWAAGDDAIEQALAGNSEAFLAATRQEGGE